MYYFEILASSILSGCLPGARVIIMGLLIMETKKKEKKRDKLEMRTF